MIKIEEDIKVLEEFINRCKECKFATCEQCEINWKEVQAIENLINRNRTLEKEIKLMKSVNIDDNYIPKSKVREKIDILNTNIVNAERFDRDYIGNCRFAKYILQELLQKGDK